MNYERGGEYLERVRGEGLEEFSFWWLRRVGIVDRGLGERGVRELGLVFDIWCYGRFRGRKRLGIRVSLYF